MTKLNIKQVKPFMKIECCTCKEILTIYKDINGKYLLFDGKFGMYKK